MFIEKKHLTLPLLLVEVQSSNGASNYKATLAKLFIVMIDQLGLL